jgi:hypothetical protein
MRITSRELAQARELLDLSALVELDRLLGEWELRAIHAEVQAAARPAGEHGHAIVVDGLCPEVES